MNKDHDLTSVLGRLCDQHVGFKMRLVFYKSPNDKVIYSVAAGLNGGYPQRSTKEALRSTKKKFDKSNKDTKVIARCFSRFRENIF